MTNPTYAQLNRVLTSLGFSAQEPEPGTRVFRHPSGAVLIFPILPDQDEILQHHLVGTRMTLDAFGIAAPPEFATQLQKAS